MFKKPKKNCPRTQIFFPNPKDFSQTRRLAFPPLFLPIRRIFHDPCLQQIYSPVLKFYMYIHPCNIRLIVDTNASHIFYQMIVKFLLKKYECRRVLQLNILLEILINVDVINNNNNILLLSVENICILFGPVYFVLGGCQLRT